jgi:hypothetical protein
MFPLTPDYSPQMFAYLQAWRQFLEQWAAMMALPRPPAPSMYPSAPFMPPTAPFMPPMPPFMAPTAAAPAPPPTAQPPAPGDYTQQLFGYLQAWREYLEQATGTCPGSPQAPTAQPSGKSGTADGKASSPLGPPQQIDVPPVKPGLSADGGELVEVPPTSGEFRSEFRLPGLNPPSPFGPGSDATQYLNPPDYAFGYRDRPSDVSNPASTVVYTAGTGAASETSEAGTTLPAASPFSAIIERVEHTATPLIPPKSLFSSQLTQTASAKIEGPGGHSA